MAEQCISPRRNLISLLLTYPQQTNKILSNNQKLIDQSLVLLMELVSSKMEKAGNREAATFLKNVLERISLEFMH
ncbi:MAG: hypothetical protein ACRC2R_03440 [Xenococcaceae cyanobacterium]